LSASPSNIVIAGGGQAGAQAAISLRQAGFAGEITIVCGEPVPPYQRPPLSKAFLKEELPFSRLLLRPESFYVANRIDVRLGDMVQAIDRAANAVTLASGAVLPFDRLILATGTRNRVLGMEGIGLPGVHCLRSFEEARTLRAAMAGASRMVIIGGGFIGLEVAATAQARGIDVTVLEGASRLMGRAVSPPISEFFLEAHRSKGTHVVLDAKVERIVGEDRIEAVLTRDGTVYPCDLALLAVGVIPNIELARDAGLAADNGVVVDEFLATTDPRIFAIGDCASYPSSYAGTRVRLESVQNAVDQAKCVAANVLGMPAPYTAPPWFWSDQGEYRLQIAGLTGSADDVHVVGNAGEAIAYCFRSGRLIGIETVNRPSHHMMGRKLLTSGIEVSRAELERLEFDLAAHLAAVAADPARIGDHSPIEQAR
jgi:3-phenylpropionate/trans-cinnamate dioxygenase ferredoxin reductase subunit